MGKRSQFERVGRDFYPTPYHAVEPLLGHLPIAFKFAEPCAGNGALIDHIEKAPFISCALMSDIEPQEKWIEEKDALLLNDEDLIDCDYIITNPPWSWDILDPMITRFRNYRPTWLLLSADVAHNKRMSDHMKHCAKVVSVGRVKWIPDSKYTGKDNCAWYLFHRDPVETIFIGR